MEQQDYSSTLMVYSRELSELFAPPAKLERSSRAATLAADNLAERAERLAGHSADLIQQTASFLQAEDAMVRLGAERHLLAQAAASLRVMDGLLAAAAEAGETEPPPALRSATVPEAYGFEDLLEILETPLQQAEALEIMQRAATRTAASASDEEVIASVSETLDAVLSGVADFGQDALAGLLGLDVALIKQAAGMLNEELSQAIEGISQQASRLVARAFTFLVQAYDSLLAALGQDVASELRQEAARWIQRLQEGEAMAALLGAVLQVPQTRAQVQTWVEAAEAPGAVLAQIQESIQMLPESYVERTKLAGQVLAGLGVVKRFPIAHTPMAQLASAIAYVALFGFVVYVGADYVDAPGLERLGRVPGVVHIVRDGLGAA